jgi:serine protease Do
VRSKSVSLDIQTAGRRRPAKTEKSTMRILVILALAFALPAQAQKLWTEGPLSTELGDDTPVTFGAFSKLAEQCAPAVVSIETESARGSMIHPFFGPIPDEGGRRGAGSGVIIRADGQIVTNNHVVEGARSIQVHLLDGRKFEAELVGRDPATDLALIKVKNPGGDLPVVPLGDSDALKIGSWVVAIGNPMGLSHTVTAGIVSAKGRREVRPDGRLRYPDFIQTDASINPGNSGGPLFNLRGEVVGINSAINAHAQGIGFAIPVNMVKTVLPQLAGEGRVARSWLGVGIAPVTGELARSLGLKKAGGAAVIEVVPGGPAADGGLREEDVILKFDGKPIERHDDLPWLASTAGIGKRVTLEVLRNGEPTEVVVKLERMPGEDETVTRLDKQGSGTRDGQAILGMRLGSLDRVQRAQGSAGVGALVVGLDAGSPAQRGGVQRGDVIVRCNGEAVRGPEDLTRLITAVPEGGLIRLLVERDGGRAFLAFTR